MPNNDAKTKKRAVMTNRTFDEIENVTLRTWNRCALAFNLAEDKGKDASEMYMSQFDQKSKRQMLIMFNYIEAKGYENVKREVFRGV